jgi:uncharacterized protein YggE
VTPEASDGTITVHGEAVVPAVPDQIRFRLTVSAVKDRSEDALQDVTARGRQLDQLLTELGIPRDQRSTSGVSVSERREWIDGRSEHRGFEAQASVDVRIDDPSIAGRLIQGAVDGAGAYVDGPWWHVDGDKPARTEACAAAARDTHRKAEAYAHALGVRLGEVRSVTESAAPVGPTPRMLAAGARGAGAEGIELDPTLDVTANVTITYGIDGDVARRT